MRPVEERHATPAHVIARARGLRRAGYTILASVADCGHWNGFLAFHPERERQGEAPIAIASEVAMSSWGDREAGLKAVYEADG